MALLDCPDCSGKVSDQAPTCPHCGRPMPKKKPKNPFEPNYDGMTPDQVAAAKKKRTKDGFVGWAVIGVCTLLWFTMCRTEDKPTAPPPYVTSGEEITKAEGLVKAQLRDPESATFTNVRSTGPDLTCGFVNSRNGFGGFGGNQPFYVRFGKLEIVEETGMEYEKTQFAKLCDPVMALP